MLKGKRLRMDLQEAEQRFQLLAAHAPLGIFRADAHGNLVDANQQWYDILGIGPSELANWSAGIHWVDAIPFKGRWREGLAARQGIVVDFRYVRRDRAEVNCSLRAVAMRDGRGSVTGWIGTLQDVSTRRRSEGQLERDALFRVLVQGTRTHAIVMLDVEGRVMTWGAGAERVFGHRAVDVVGQPSVCLYVPEDAVAGKPARVLALAEATGTYEEGGMLQRKDASRFFAGTVINALRDRDGRLQGFSVVVRDETERQAFQEELERSNRDLRDFAATVSHDLKAPLSTVMLNVAVLREREAERLGSDAKERLDRMEKAAARMADYIRAILEYSRIGFQQAPMETVDINELLAVVRTDLESRLGEVHGRIEHGALPSVWGNRVQLAQLMQNLLGNAVKYHRPGVPPVISVAASSLVDDLGSAFCRIVVQDNGRGFEAGEFHRMVRPFGRRERGVEGHGLGLATCLKIVERHRGRFSAESRPGEGSTFFVDLPVR